MRKLENMGQKSYEGRAINVAQKTKQLAAGINDHRKKLRSEKVRFSMSASSVRCMRALESMGQKSYEVGAINVARYSGNLN
jgi:hypothetical protein